MTDMQSEPKTIMVVGTPRVSYPSGVGATYAAILERGRTYKIINPKDAQQARQIIESGQYLDLLIIDLLATGLVGSTGLLRETYRLSSNTADNGKRDETKYLITGEADASNPIVKKVLDELQGEWIEVTYLQKPDIGGLFRVVRELTNNP